MQPSLAHSGAYIWSSTEFQSNLEASRMNLSHESICTVMPR